MQNLCCLGKMQPFMIALLYLHGKGVLHPGNYAILVQVFFFMCCIVSRSLSLFKRNIKKSLTRIKESVNCLLVASAALVLVILQLYLKR